MQAMLDGTSACAKQKSKYSADNRFNTYVKTIYNGENGLPGGKANDIAQNKRRCFVDRNLWRVVSLYRKQFSMGQ